MKNKYVKRKCKICGKEFYVLASRLKYGGGKTCSYPCKDKYVSLILRKRVKR